MTEHPAWLKGARTAPSAHNTQPWRFRLEEKGIAIGWDPERTLPAADPTDRDLFLALGAAIEAAALSSAAAGQPLRFVFDDSRRCFVGHLVEESRKVADADLALAKLLDERHTARINHLKEPLPRPVMDAFVEEAREYNCRVFFISSDEDLRHVGLLSREATASQLADSAIYDELWAWMRLDKTAPRYKRDGLTADTLNLDNVMLGPARVLLQPKRMRKMVNLHLHEFLAMDTESLVKHSASLCLLVTRDLERATLLNAGRLLLRLWLIAAREGLSTHPVSALLDCADTVEPTATAFSAHRLSPNYFGPPAAVFRLGKTTSVPRAPRLPIEELLLEPLT